VTKRTEKKMFNGPVPTWAHRNIGKEFKMTDPWAKPCDYEHESVRICGLCQKICFCVHDHETNFDSKTYLKRDLSQNCTVPWKKGTVHIWNNTWPDFFSILTRIVPRIPNSKQIYDTFPNRHGQILKSPWSRK
jgi:hypothetical protein